ncbi:S66 family peptidase [Paenibacillus pseudetheri]|uniref:Murein peptide carboxypeptidase n=1 Tax=Paenibacillus pseudetheri TaxID=2897682 RepID=A0ABM9BFE6_9BACL|nr:S66 peptidase family protein [Paenibacillus pseudetheri]CAH1057568.1 putative murein peptide carboxypeptidase [Paenibacillus pseudetheri]
MSNALKLTPGDKVGFIACSDGVRVENLPKVEELIKIMNSCGLEIVKSNTLFRRDSYFSGNHKERATELNRLFKNDEIRAIFDISGGDSANQILEYINYDHIRLHPKPFFGMSDLSVILNALHTQSNSKSYHYQLMNLVSSDGAEQQSAFYRTFFEVHNDLYDFGFHWVRGNQMSGIIIGGNIRCFMKLAGTSYFPDPSNKILFLESLSGRANKIVSLFAQLQQVKYFDKLAGVILGSFTELESYNEFSIVEEYVKEISRIPIVKTNEIGHGSNSKCLVVGEKITL